MANVQFAAVAFGYLVGSIPFALLLTWRNGVDIRRTGSGNVGAANVLRTRGLLAAILTLCLDGAKGSAAVLVVREWTPDPSTAVSAGLASIVGHAYPVWLGFRGGKGVATAAGAFGVLAPAALVAAAAVFAATVAMTKYVSAGSLAGAVALTATVALRHSPAPIIVGAALAAMLIAYRHRGNVVRIAAGTERRLGERTS